MELLHSPTWDAQHSRSQAEKEIGWGWGLTIQFMDFHLIPSPYFEYSATPLYPSVPGIPETWPHMAQWPSSLLLWAKLVSWMGWKTGHGNLADSSKGFQPVFCLGLCPIIPPSGISGVSNSWTSQQFCDKIKSAFLFIDFSSTEK